MIGVLRRVVMGRRVWWSLLWALSCGRGEAPSPDAETDAGAADVILDAAGPDSGAQEDATIVDSGPPADTWESWASGFFGQYCVECHGAGNALRDYTTYADAYRDRDEVRCGVAPARPSGCAGFPPPSQFPVGDGPFPSAEERSRIVAWIEDGALER